MKKAIIRIFLIMAWLILTPFAGSNIAKADDTDIVNNNSRSGVVIGSFQITPFITYYYIQDDQTNIIYTYGCLSGSLSFNVYDKVQFDLCYSTSGKILIKSIIRK